MVKEDLPPETSQSDTPPPPGLVYRRVRDQELRRAMADITAISYGVSIEMGREAVDRESIWDDACFGYVGFEDGSPVTTAAAYVLPECLYVALVGTAPEARKRGYAQSITAHALREAAASSGLRRSILHATSMARSVYERLGFRPVVDFSLHLPVALLQSMAAHDE
jgi:GNAT superfamily N-acetyltransferase